MKTRGFTLIELSIVLVIIGLIAGGILVGREMIASATLRSQVSQIEKLHTSVNAFRSKYECFPGDCQNPAQFGFFSTGMTGAAGRGNKDGILQDLNNNGPSFLYISGESLVFWRHLSDAGLTDKAYGATLASGGLVPVDQTPDQTNLWVPAAKLGRGISIIAYGQNGVNYYNIIKLSSPNYPTTSIVADGNYADQPGLKPREVYYIETKLDDGVPQSGNIIERSNGIDAWLGRNPTANNGCNVSSTAYDTGSTNGELERCVITVKFQ